MKEEATAMMNWLLSLDWKLIVAGLIGGVLLLVATKIFEAIVPDRGEERFRESLLEALGNRETTVKIVESKAEVAQVPSVEDYCEMMNSLGRHYFLTGATLRYQGKAGRANILMFAAYFYAIDAFEKAVRVGGKHSFMDSAFANIEYDEEGFTVFARWVHPYPEDAVAIMKNVMSNENVKPYLRDAAKEVLGKLYEANPKLIKMTQE